MGPATAGYATLEHPTAIGLSLPSLAAIIWRHGLRLLRCRSSLYLPFGEPALSLLSTTFLIVSQTQGDAWFKPSEENVSAGVCVRIETGHFRVFPYDNPFLAPFEAAIRGLNPLVAVKIRSAAAHSALSTTQVVAFVYDANNADSSTYSPDSADALYLDANTRIQILDTVAHLPKADKEQCAAFLVRGPAAISFSKTDWSSARRTRARCVV